MRSGKSFCFLWLLFGVAQPCLAWQSDVHHLLTTEVAILAGMCREQANELGLANARVDDGPTSAGRQTLFNVVLGSTEDAAHASRVIWFHHFRSQEEPPADAARRRVDVSNCSRAGYEVTVAQSAVDAGRALHPFQDCWSHSGVPDWLFRRVGIPLRPDYAWAHPESRGGWWRHKADKAFLHRDEVEQVALRSFHLLLSLRGTRPELFRCGPPKDELSVRELTAGFLDAAESKQGLRQWAAGRVSNGEPSSAVLSTIAATTLPAGDEAAAFNTMVSATFFGEQRGEVFTSQERILGMVRHWLTEGQFGGLVELVDLEAMPIPAPVRGVADERQARQLYAVTFFAQWLVADHGLVEDLGHGHPEEEGFFGVRELARSNAPIDYRATALSLPDVLRQGTAADYWVVIELGHLPYDVVVLEVDEREDEHVSLVGLHWLAL